jgi:hypothetical protein
MQKMLGEGQKQIAKTQKKGQETVKKVEGQLEAVYESR